MIEHFVVADEDGFRADKVVANVLGKDASYSFLQKIFRLKKVKVNGKKVHASDHLKAGDAVRIFLSQKSLDGKTECRQETANSKEQTKERNRKLCEQFQRMIIFENADFLAINKPTNLAVQMGSKVKMCVEIMMRAYMDNLYLVHRIDKDTSGVLLIAKGRLAAQKLTKMFRENRIHKTYLAIVDGKIKKYGIEGGIIDNYLHKTVVGNEEKMAVCADHQVSACSYAPQHAITTYIPYKISDPNFGYYTLLKLRPQTGRKHQLRVHCADVLLAPILGDKKYDRNFSKNCSKNPDKYRHLMLHAYSIEMQFEADKENRENKNGNENNGNEENIENTKNIEIIADLPDYFPKDLFK